MSNPGDLLYLRTVAKRIRLYGNYIRARKDGRPFFDIRKCAEDLAKELIACGALVVEGNWALTSDSYDYGVYVMAGMKKPGLDDTNV